MFDLILMLLTTLSVIPLIGNITQSAYGVNVFSVSKEWKKEIYSIPNILNWFQRSWDQIEGLIENQIESEIEKSKSKSEDKKQEDRILAHAYKRIQRALLGHPSFVYRIELFNPNDGRKRRLVGERERQRELKGQKEGYGKTGAGNSPFRLSQIVVSGVAKPFVEKHGTTFTTVVDDITSADVKENGIGNLDFASVTNDGETYMVKFNELFDLVEEYHEQKAKEREARQKERNDSETEIQESAEVAGDVTIEQFLNGEVKASEIENVDLLKQFRKDPDVTGGKKATVTKQINKLEREMQ